jgi:hypothetical protein
MRKVMMMSIEEVAKLSTLQVPNPPIIGVPYKYVDEKGHVFFVVKLKLFHNELIERLPIVIE